MSDFSDRPWLNALLRRSGLRALVERYHRDHQQPPGLPRARLSWKTVLHGSRLSFAYPALVFLLAMISAGSGFYPYGPVLAAAVVFAPERWRSTYLAACLGAASGAALLTLALQSLGEPLLAQYLPDLGLAPQWTRIEHWVAARGAYALALIAALPLPEIPPLLILALAKTPVAAIWLAIFCGKLCKYGLYIFLVRLLLAALRQNLQQSPPQK